MAEGRMLKKRISESKKLAALSSDSPRLLYTWLIPFLDIADRFSADPDIIKGHIFPKIKSWTTKKIIKCLEELHNAGLIVYYESNDEWYLQFIQTLQKKYPDREAASIIPAPSEKDLESCGLMSSHAKIKGKEIKGKEIKSSSIDDNPQTNINFNFETENWENIKEKDTNRWKQTYPACDIKQELLYMADWLISNPSKKKSNYARFISNWLRKQQDQGGTKKGHASMSKKEQRIKETTRKFIERGKNDDK